MSIPRSPLFMENISVRNQTRQKKIASLLSQDLDFHSLDSGYASHNFHSFPAKFPPQLPKKFIGELTQPGDVVLDPMMGSGTTVLEAYLTGRQGMGLDIDPLAVMLTKAKVTPLNSRAISRLSSRIIEQAQLMVAEREAELREKLGSRWDVKTRNFIDYWFALETQIELMALITEIERIDDPGLKTFFKLAFSSIIITKSGGVSLALDLAHTRPHKAKVVINASGEVISGRMSEDPASRKRFLTKRLRSPIKEFAKRIDQNLNGLKESDLDTLQPPLVRMGSNRLAPYIVVGNAQLIPIKDESVDLIVTSPPYASNAIDYMRAHKFSLVWMGYPVDDLGQKRKEYIGGEAVTDFEFTDLPDQTKQLVAEVSSLDERKGRVLHRYYSEMTRTLREMYRVLKPGKAAVVVVGSSVMRGKDTLTHTCLAEIGRRIGFTVPKIGVRNLDRNRRMMPAGFERNRGSQIQQRMHEEYVIGFYKPET